MPNREVPTYEYPPLPADVREPYERLIRACWYLPEDIRPIVKMNALAMALDHGDIETVNIWRDDLVRWLKEH